MYQKVSYTGEGQARDLLFVGKFFLRSGVSLPVRLLSSAPCSTVWYLPCWPLTTAQPAAVAGHPAADTLLRHFVNNNKKTACVSGRNSVKYAYETAEAYKAGRGEFAPPHTPMQETTLRSSPIQQKLSAPKVHYNGFPGDNQWGNKVDVCVASAV